jgi:hypothetical protein
MTDTEKAMYVTRREFYVALMIVWIYIMLVIGDMMRLEEHSVSRFLLWAASFFMAFVYMVRSMRSQPKRSAGTSHDDAIDVKPPI